MDTSTLTTRVKERVLPIVELVESMRERIVSPDSLEEAMTELTVVITALPADFFSVDEVKLLLQFCYGVDASNDEFLCLDLISYLVNCSHFSPIEDAMVVYHLLEDVDVQTRTQKERHKIYVICEALLPKASAELRANPRRVGEALIRSISGEADPRCLMVVFDLVRIYCRSFNVRNEIDIAFQLFDMLCVYYPLQYKPKSEEDVTFEELSSSCRSTLLYCPLFSKVFYMFIADKLQDPDDSYEDKMEICKLLLDGVESATFEKADFFESLENIFDGLRTAAVDPRFKGDMSDLDSYLTKLIQLLNDEDKLYLKAAVDSGIQNLEPFIVQPAMGLMDKALTYLRPFAQAATGFEKTVLSRVFGWLLEKIQSPVEPTCESALEALQNWAHVGPLETRAAVLSVFSDSLLSSFEVAEKTCPALAATVRDVFIPAFAEAGLLENVKSVALELMETADFETMGGQKRTSVTNLISTLASKNPAQAYELIGEFENKVKAKGDSSISNLNGVYCAAVRDDESWKKYRTRILGFLAGEKLLPCLAADVEMTEKLVGPTTIPRELLEAVKTVNIKDADLLPVAQLVKRLASFLAEEEKIGDAAEYPHFFLAVVMEGNLVEIEKAYAKATNLVAKKTLALARACCGGGSSAEGVEKWSHTQYLKGRLIQGQPVDEQELEQYFTHVTKGDIDASELFSFEPPFGCPDALGIKRKSPLWRQRLLHFLLPKYVAAVVSSEDSAERLISLLPDVFRFLKQCDSGLSEYYGDVLRPVKAKTLENPSSYDSSLVRVLLPVLVDDLGPVSDETAQKFGKMLIDMVRAAKEPAVVLSALSALEILAKKASRGALRSLLPAVLKATTETMISSSRHVRKKAAIIRELWTSRSDSTDSK